MGFAKSYSAQSVGLRAHIVCVEVDISKGMASFSVVGLPDKSVDESKDRISAAIKNSGYKSPKAKNQKIIISLTPANIKKEGTLFDLACALTYLLAGGEIKFDTKEKLFLGELGLNGELRPIKGALPLVQKAKEKGFTEVFLPYENADEASIIEGITVFGCKTLLQVIRHLNTMTSEDETASKAIPPHVPGRVEKRETLREYGFEDVRGARNRKTRFGNRRNRKA
ncbi:MAG: hypothetical protein NTZ13_01320 [Candidatus Parcubacteria bacterium]|nr:hypothetical protein [Candidatus Parcubacteria bacterium]